MINTDEQMNKNGSMESPSSILVINSDFRAVKEYSPYNEITRKITSKYTLLNILCLFPVFLCFTFTIVTLASLNTGSTITAIETKIAPKVYKNTLGLKLTCNAFLWINSKKPFVEPSAFVIKKPSGTPTILLPIERIADCSV